MKKRFLKGARVRLKYLAIVPRWVTGNARALPDFLIVGGQKCGTTSLYRYLVQHPAVLPALRKETHFFTSSFDRGERWYRAHFPLRSNMIIGPGDDGRRITGEATPYYLFHPLVPARAANMLPNARIIILVRNPIDRAYSHFVHNRRKRREKRRFEEAIRDEVEMMLEERRPIEQFGAPSLQHQHYSYLSRGVYHEQIQRWADVYPVGSIKIVDAGKFFRSSRETMMRVHSFLGIDNFEYAGYPAHNKQQYAVQINGDTRSRLRRFFTEHNARLNEMLGYDLEWK